MEDKFYIKCHCEFAITSKEIDVNEITQLMNIAPSRFFAKGEMITSKHSGSSIARPHNLWAISTENLIKKENDVSTHIALLKSILNEKIAVIEDLKKLSDIELTFWVWIETDDAGIGIDIFSDELLFISRICQRIHFSFIADKPLL
jgi:hypothetical protein